MDNSKIHDTRFSNLKPKSSIASFLRTRKTTNNKRTTTADGRKYRSRGDGKVVPHYSFKFTDYQIRQHVEYTVVLTEAYSILGRSVKQQYSFKTRYSMLEGLDRKMGELGLPGKKWFGNKSKEFIERRRGELEQYLNRVAKNPNVALLQFVGQIKSSNFNSGLKKPFSIE